MLGHYIDVEYGLIFVGVSQTKNYRTFPVNVCRPPRESEILELQCPICDAELLLHIRSIEATTRKRRRFFIVGASGLGFVTLEILSGIVMHIPLPTTPITLAFIGSFFAGVITAVAGFYYLLQEDGVRLYPTSSEDNGSHIRVS